MGSRHETLAHLFSRTPPAWLMRPSQIGPLYTMVRHHCRRRVLFYKIQVRPRPCRSYPLWRPWFWSGCQHCTGQTPPNHFTARQKVQNNHTQICKSTLFDTQKIQIMKMAWSLQIGTLKLRKHDFKLGYWLVILFLKTLPKRWRPTFRSCWSRTGGERC